MKRVLIYTVHKAASMFLHRLTINVADEFGIPYYSVNDKQYHNTIKQSSWSTFIEKNLGQGCFGPIRAGETEDIFPEVLSEYSIILHLRDPRDALTSLFFSQTYSHPKKKGGFNPSNGLRKKWEREGVDLFVLSKIPLYKERYQLLISNLHNNANVHVVRYEDMVSNYPEWLNTFLSAFSDFDIPSSQTDNSISKIKQGLLNKYKDEFTVPKSEDVYLHKRQIKAGDHRNKLKPETIEILNHEFSDVLELLSYE